MIDNNKSINKFNLICILIALVISGLPVALGAPAQDYNLTLNALNQSGKDLRDMIEAGYSIQRINDTLSQAEQLFAAQSALLKAGGTADFSLILERTKEISNLRKQAEELGDELKALQTRLKDVQHGSEAFGIFDKAKKEFDDERYDKVAALIEDAYSKITEEQAFQTRFRTIYEASTRTIKDFFRKNWKIITSVTSLLLITYWVLHKKVAIFLLDKKIKALNFEKEVLQNLIKQAQYEYFHLFKIPEDLYHIRITKFGELIRDIDRQIPLLTEEREKVRGVIKDEAKAERIEKFKRKLIVASLSLFVFIAAAFSSVLYLKIASSIKIIDIIKKIGFDIQFLQMVPDYLLIILQIFLTLLILTAILILFYIISREKNLQQLGLSGQENILQFYKIFLSFRLNKTVLSYQKFVERITTYKEYRKFMKEKGVQDKFTKRYLRRQRLLFLRIKFLEKIFPVIHPIKFIRLRKVEEKLIVPEEFISSHRNEEFLVQPSIKDKFANAEEVFKSIFNKLKSYKMTKSKELFKEKELSSELEKPALEEPITEEIAEQKEEIPEESLDRELTNLDTLILQKFKELKPAPKPEIKLKPSTTEKLAVSKIVSSVKSQEAKAKKPSLKQSKYYLMCKNFVAKSYQLINKKDLTKAINCYKQASKIYLKLQKSEKKSIYSAILNLYNNILKEKGKAHEKRQKQIKKSETRKVIEKQIPKHSENYLQCNTAINNANKFMAENNFVNAKRFYIKAREIYLKLDSAEKKRMYNDILKLYNNLTK